MAKSADLPDYRTTTSAKVGKVVLLDGYIVPEVVVMTMTGGGDIDGRRWPDMKFTFEVRDGAAVCTDFHVSSKPGDRPIRTPHLQFIDLDKLAILAFQDHAAKQISPGHFQVSAKIDPDVAKQIRPMVEAGYSDPLAELKHVARVYCDPANRKTPAHNVFLILGYKSPETANRRIRLARAKNFIPPKKSTSEEYDRKFVELTRELEN